MYARHTTVKFDPAQTDAAIAFINEHAVPAVKGRPGLIAGYWGMDRANGVGFGVTLWDDEASMDATDRALAEVRADATQDLGVNFTSIGSYEIVAQA
jgi:hypothetical protein